MVALVIGVGVPIAESRMEPAPSGHTIAASPCIDCWAEGK